MKPTELVQHFLHLMENRELDAAEALMAPDAVIIFPGGRRFASQREMVAAARGRYRWIKKKIEQVEAFPGARGTVVYVRGTLYGVNRHGTPFDAIRFVDRFVVDDERIVRQEVWNDLAETGALEEASGPA